MGFHVHLFLQLSIDWLSGVFKSFTLPRAHLMTQYVLSALTPILEVMREIALMISSMPTSHAI